MPNLANIISVIHRKIRLVLKGIKVIRIYIYIDSIYRPMRSLSKSMQTNAVM